MRLSPAFALAAGLLLAACAGPSPAEPPALPSSPDTLPAEAEAAPGVDLPDRGLVLMNLAAHPDDEDGLTMAYYRGHQDAVVYSVIYTRGEGGQNEAGAELYERLGAIRTRETLEAARILGTQVFFLNHYDFGYSKHAREAFAEWGAPQTSFWDARPAALDAAAGREAVTAQLVRVIRRLQPDVVFTNHDTTTVGPGRQHGHHQAVGISAYDAVALAADPAYRPEDLAADGTAPWQVQRLFLRRRAFFDDGTSRDLAVPVGDTCAATAVRPEEPCNERAVAAVARHVSQGFDKFAHRFRRDTTHFELLWAAPGTPPVPAGAGDLAAGLTRAAPPATTTTYLIDSARIPGVAGIAAAPPSESGAVVPAGRAGVAWAPRAGRDRTFVPPAVDRWGHLESALAPVVLADASSGEARFSVPSDLAPTLPAHRAQYSRWLSSPPYFLAHVPYGGTTDAASYVPIEVAPPVVVDLDAAPIRLVPGENRIEVSVRTHDPQAERVAVHLAIDPPAGEHLDTEAVVVPASRRRATLVATLPDDAPPGRYTVRVSASVDRTAADGPAADPYVATRPAAVLPDVSVAPGLRVGFVRSYDGTMAEALATMGAAVTELDSMDLAAGDFGRFDTIVLDIRAYLDRFDLRAHNGRLLDWVRDGGHLVVGYHKLMEWNAGRAHPLLPELRNPDAGWAPYPFDLGRERVTVQGAPVTVQEPEHPLFRAPHAITPSDWDGWVQERGLYFPTDSADPRYTRLLAMADPGEDPLTTGLLYARVGAGTYVYSPLVWYRQLAALNPGAWRLVANLASLPLVDGR